MRFYSLPPTGNAISTSKSVDSVKTLEFGCSASWVGSGTQALAVALLEIKKQNPGVAAPEVIVPAYCCPDLLSAAQFAGFVPVMADVQKHSPKFCLQSLADQVTGNTLAVIAINFLGVKENIAGLREALAGHSVSIIEDNAQWFPESAEEYELTGDFATFSFGRGKALSLLGGGLILSHAPIGVDFSGEAEAADAKWQFKVQLMSFLSSPRIYPFLEAAPFLTLGETRFYALSAVERLPKSKQVLVSANWARYAKRKRVVEELYRSELTFNAMQSDIEASNNRLLRYPYLFETKEQRDQFFQLAFEEGLGVSKLYQTSLPNVEGVSEAGFALNKQHATQAQAFAERLVTLPTHERVPLDKAKRIVELIHQI